MVVVVTTAGAITVVVVMAIAAVLGTKASAVVVDLIAVEAASMGVVVVDSMEAVAGRTAEAADSMAAVDMVVEATAADTGSFPEFLIEEEHRLAGSTASRFVFMSLECRKRVS